MNLKRHEIESKIERIAKEFDFVWFGNYISSKKPLLFRCNRSGVIVQSNWSNIKTRQRISRKNSIEYIDWKFRKKCKKLGFFVITGYTAYVNKTKYQCKKCGTFYERPAHKVHKCGICNDFYKNNNGITKKFVNNNGHKLWWIYFVYLHAKGCYKIGLTKGKKVQWRYGKSKITLICKRKMLLKDAFILEQYLVSQFSENKYTGKKFAGYTEAFNRKLDVADFLEQMGASLSDVELRELLEQLEAANQQPRAMGTLSRFND